MIFSALTFPIPAAFPTSLSFLDCLVQERANILYMLVAMLGLIAHPSFNNLYAREILSCLNPKSPPGHSLTSVVLCPCPLCALAQTGHSWGLSSLLSLQVPDKLFKHWSLTWLIPEMGNDSCASYYNVWYDRDLVNIISSITINAIIRFIR